MNEALFGRRESPVDIHAIKTPKIGFHQLLVLGNGFDLECGLPTKFCHFFEPRIEALETQNWKKTGRLDNLGYEATPTVWDFLLRTKTYAPWYRVEDAVNDLVLSAGDGTSGATGVASKLIVRMSGLATTSDEKASPADDNATSSDEEDLLSSAIEFMAIDCADRLRQSSSTWSPQELIDYLGMQLTKLEDNFSSYMRSICEGNDDYVERSLKILKWMLADRWWPAEERLVFNTTVLSFNYTNPFKQLVEKRDTIRIINVHGSLDKRIIFGIDSTKCVDNPLAFPFSKTYRVMTAGTDFGEGAVHATGGSLLSLETSVIKFYGHSLGEPDYAYFQAIFDSVNLYASNVKLVFYYKPHHKQDGGDDTGPLSEQRERNTMAIRVARLLEEYGKTLDNKNHGRNLMHKLMIEGRLEVRLLKVE